MFDIIETILAAGRRKPGGNFQWLVPAAFAVVFILNLLGKIKDKRDQDKKLDRELDEAEPLEEPKLRYKAIDDASVLKASGARRPVHAERQVQPRPAEARKPVLEQLRETIVAQVEQYSAPAAKKPQAKTRPRSKPVKHAVQQRPAQKRQVEKPVEEAPKTQLPQIATYRNLANPNDLRTAIILSEVLGKPRALRELY
jgi:hypothetical protein